MGSVLGSDRVKGGLSRTLQAESSVSGPGILGTVHTLARRFIRAAVQIKQTLRQPGIRKLIRGHAQDVANLSPCNPPLTTTMTARLASLDSSVATCCNNCCSSYIRVLQTCPSCYACAAPFVRQHGLFCFVLAAVSPAISATAAVFLGTGQLHCDLAMNYAAVR